MSSVNKQGYYELIDNYIYNYPFPPNLRPSLIHIGIRDIDTLWPAANISLAKYFPLSNVILRNKLNQNSYQTVSQIPIEFVPIINNTPLSKSYISNNSKIINNTGNNRLKQPQYWHLLPYFHLYLLKCESSDDYKLQKTALKKWFESINQNNYTNNNNNSLTLSNNNLNNSTNLSLNPNSNNELDSSSINSLYNDYIIVYLPLGSNKNSKKLYDKLKTDFNAANIVKLELFNTQTAQTVDNNNNNNSNINNNNNNNNGNADVNILLSLIKSKLIRSFERRCEFYEFELKRRMNNNRITGWNVNLYVIVKESSIWNYMQMQFITEAIKFYDEIITTINENSPQSSVLFGTGNSTLIQNSIDLFIPFFDTDSLPYTELIHRSLLNESELLRYIQIRKFKLMLLNHTILITAEQGRKYIETRFNAFNAIIEDKIVIIKWLLQSSLDLLTECENKVSLYYAEQYNSLITSNSSDNNAINNNKLLQQQSKNFKSQHDTELKLLCKIKVHLLQFVLDKLNLYGKKKLKIQLNWNCRAKFEPIEINGYIYQNTILQPSSSFSTSPRSRIGLDLDCYSDFAVEQLIEFKKANEKVFNDLLSLSETQAKSLLQQIVQNNHKQKSIYNLYNARQTKINECLAVNSNSAYNYNSYLDLYTELSSICSRACNIASNERLNLHINLTTAHCFYLLTEYSRSRLLYQECLNKFESENWFQLLLPIYCCIIQNSLYLHDFALVAKYLLLSLTLAKKGYKRKVYGVQRRNWNLDEVSIINDGTIEENNHGNLRLLDDVTEDINMEAKELDFPCCNHNSESDISMIYLQSFLFHVIRVHIPHIPAPPRIQAQSVSANAAAPSTTTEPISIQHQLQSSGYNSSAAITNDSKESNKDIKVGPLIRSCSASPVSPMQYFRSVRTIGVRTIVSPVRSKRNSTNANANTNQLSILTGSQELGSTTQSISSPVIISERGVSAPPSSLLLTPTADKQSNSNNIMIETSNLKRINSQVSAELNNSFTTVQPLGTILETDLSAYITISSVQINCYKYSNPMQWTIQMDVQSFFPATFNAAGLGLLITTANIEFELLFKIIQLQPGINTIVLHVLHTLDADLTTQTENPRIQYLYYDEDSYVSLASWLASISTNPPAFTITELWMYKNRLQMWYLDTQSIRTELLVHTTAPGNPLHKLNNVDYSNSIPTSQLNEMKPIELKVIPPSESTLFIGKMDPSHIVLSIQIERRAVKDCRLLLESSTGLMIQNPLSLESVPILGIFKHQNGSIDKKKYKYDSFEHCIVIDSIPRYSQLHLLIPFVNLSHSEYLLQYPSSLLLHPFPTQSFGRSINVCSSNAAAVNSIKHSIEFQFISSFHSNKSPVPPNTISPKLLTPLASGNQTISTSLSMENPLLIQSYATQMSETNILLQIHIQSRVSPILQIEQYHLTSTGLKIIADANNTKEMLRQNKTVSFAFELIKEEHKSEQNENCNFALCLSNGNNRYQMNFPINMEALMQKPLFSIELITLKQVELGQQIPFQVSIKLLSKEPIPQTRRYQYRLQYDVNNWTLSGKASAQFQFDNNNVNNTIQFQCALTPLINGVLKLPIVTVYERLQSTGPSINWRAISCSEIQQSLNNAECVFVNSPNTLESNLFPLNSSLNIVQ